ncbi:hypothetical protein ACF08W_33880 [Streptomyces sp. NPDC015144]|uniref:hypothetical protein n=1 Tax=Streptomyces sp. NPDC015144 TaxID=3364944 RepID=UPI0036FD77B4
MSSLALVVAALVVVVVAMVLVGRFCLTRYRPALATPLMVVLSAATVFATVFVPIVLR